MLAPTPFSRGYLASQARYIQPVALGGPDTIWNLQPLQWKNNRHKSDNYPNWNCAV